MTTLPAPSILAEPQDDGRISGRTLAYVSEAAREQLYDLVVQNCIETGVTKATLAKRLGKDPGQISRLLGAPGNWTIDTFAELLFAINGSMLDARSYLPLKQAVSNRRAPACFDSSNAVTGLLGAFTDATTIVSSGDKAAPGSFVPNRVEWNYAR